MIGFDFQPRTRIVFGPNTIESLGELATELNASRAMVVSDPGVVAAGHSQRGIDALKAAEVQTLLYSEVHENPSTVDVGRALEAANDFQPDLLIGLGGGSSMDCAKGVNFLFTNGGQMKDYWGVGKATRPMLPMFAVPTTAGTGSETQSFALISDAESHRKMACGDKKAACRIALLDPTLTLTQPTRVTALTGIDALAHALETYVTNKRNSVSLAFSREAWRLLGANFARVIESPDDLEARGGMQLGASFAGLAIENSMLGAAHALANPLTARCNVTHGQAIAVMLPHVVRFNGAEVGSWYQELIDATGHCPGFPDPDGGVDALAEFATSAAARAGLATTLAAIGVDRDALPGLAADAAQQWTGTFNPRHVGVDELLRLYECAF